MINSCFISVIYYLVKCVSNIKRTKIKTSIYNLMVDRGYGLVYGIEVNCYGKYFVFSCDNQYKKRSQ